MKKWFAKWMFNLAGGVPGAVEFALSWFNDNVLSKVNGAEAAVYCKDVREFGQFLGGVFERHSEWMGGGRRALAKALTDAVSTLAGALEDSKVDAGELDAIVQKVKDCYAAWVAAR